MMRGMKGIGRQSYLIVFDFDHTVVDCNTDEVIPAALGRGSQHEEMRIAKDRLQWTKLMDTLIASFSSAELRKAAHDSVVMDPTMTNVFQYLIKAKERYLPVPGDAKEGNQTVTEATGEVPPPFIELNIASDANLLFIDAALEARLPFAKPHISQIHSNPYYDLEADGVPADAGRDICYGPQRPSDSINDDDEAARDALYNASSGFQRKSRVCWYEPYGHSCACCLAGGKPNMCKSRIIQRLLHTTRLIDPTIIFVGDGANDYCPILNVLRPRDYMFARRDFPIHRIISGGAGNDVGGCCHIGLWQDASELLELFHLALDHPGARLPVLARFRDAGPREFRSVTMTTRMPAVLRRTLEDSSNRAASAGRALVERLIADAEANGPVPPLLGQQQVPSWLRNYAYTTEYDNCADNVAARASMVKVSGGAPGQVERTVATPRWGQIPWLHGEIYFYHLLWQYLMVTDAGVAATAAATSGNGDAAVSFNLITPHAFHNPLYSQACAVTTTPGIVSAPVVPQQTIPDYTWLLRTPLDVQNGVVARGMAPASATTASCASVIPYASLVPPAGDSIIPAADMVFSPYFDIFAREKHDVLANFLQVRVLPILACQPWSADLSFCGTLLRWMLWGNALDLSMFTIDQLNRTHGGNTNESNQQKQQLDGDALAAALHGLREAETRAAGAQDVSIVGNETAGVEDYLKRLIRGEVVTPDGTPVPLQVDVVMDNVGVECISDICFGLWFVEQASHRPAASSPGQAPRVVFHVKPMPYYVSDVTPQDFDILLRFLEGVYTNEKDEAKRSAMQVVLQPFVERVRECFANSSFQLDADTVWTQPSEFRDLPPRVVNRYFFTQYIATALGKTSANAPKAGSGVERALVEAALSCFWVPPSPSPTSPAAALYRMNKADIRPRTGLVLFKGDLNYRRLIGDRYWDGVDFLTTLPEDGSVELETAALRYTADQQKVTAELLLDTAVEATMSGPSFQEVVSAFWPTHVVPVCSVRTIKSECCVGVPGATKARLDREMGIGWRVSGKYGEILFAS